MKCPKCNLMWNQAYFLGSSVYTCPGCNSNYIVDGEENREIRLGLKRIVSKYGIDILRDTGKTKAMLKDYAPQARKERELVDKVMHEGVVESLLAASGDKKQVERVIDSCTNQLVKNIWITDTAARYVLMLLAEAAGIISEKDLNAACIDIYGNDNNEPESVNTVAPNKEKPVSVTVPNDAQKKIQPPPQQNQLPAKADNSAGQADPNVERYANKALQFGVYGIIFFIFVFSIIAIGNYKKYCAISRGLENPNAKWGLIAGIFGIVESAIVWIFMILMFAGVFG